MNKHCGKNIGVKQQMGVMLAGHGWFLLVHNNHKHKQFTHADAVRYMYVACAYACALVKTSLYRVIFTWAA